MDISQALIKRYEDYIKGLREANEQQEKVIAAQEKQINVLDKLVEAQNEKINMLVAQADEMTEIAKKMAGILDSLGIDMPEEDE